METTQPGLDGFLRVALRGPVVRRAAWTALLVGSLLIAINHGDAILSGSLTADNWLKMGLTLFVPYGVSTTSSVQAIRAMERA